jgi:hypothetical protein
MRRSRMIGLIALAVVLFLVVSALLARAFSVGGAENSALTALVRAEARGDAGGVVALVDGCAGNAACRARATQVSAALRHPGTVSIAQITASAGFSLGTTVGTARVAWLAGGSLPRVQCVRVRHDGNVLQGFTVQLLSVSARIGTGGDCPAHF